MIREGDTSVTAHLLRSGQFHLVFLADRRSTYQGKQNSKHVTMSDTRASEIPIKADIVVAGGGPAGATISRLLADYGFDVVLLEKRRFPRHQIGESLTPRILPIFDFLGIRSTVKEAGFLPIAGHTVCWGSPQPRTAYYSPDRRRYGFQVWRADFDTLLLSHARDSGVQVFEGQAVEGVGFQDRDSVSVRTSSQHTITAAFFIDASGHAGVLARQGLRLRDDLFRTLALTAYWHGTQEADGMDRGNTLIEAYANGMVWSLPLHTGLRNVTLLVDWQAGQSIRKNNLAPFYHAALGKIPYISRLLEGAQVAVPPRAFDASLYTAKHFADARFLLVGDAGLFIDPLSSEGVHKAMASAITGAVVVNTLLQRPQMGAYARNFYQQRQQQTYASHYHQSVLYYQQERRWPDSHFWHQRSEAAKTRLGQGPQIAPIPRSTAPQTISHLEWSATVSIEHKPTIEGTYIELRDVLITPQYPDGIRYLDQVCIPTLLRIVAKNQAVIEIIPAYLNHPDGQHCPPEAVRQVLARLYQEGILAEADSGKA